MKIKTTCLDDAGHGSHSHVSTGLDIVNGVLSSTRRCVWCGVEEHKTYGSGSRGTWKTTRRGAS